MLKWFGKLLYQNNNDFHFILSQTLKLRMWTSVLNLGISSCKCLAMNLMYLCIVNAFRDWFYFRISNV